MLLAADSVLVAGGARPREVTMEKNHIKAILGFRALVSGELRDVEPGEIVEVSSLFAKELVGWNKAEIVDPPKQAAKTEPAKEVKTEQQGEKNARK